MEDIFTFYKTHKVKIDRDECMVNKVMALMLMADNLCWSMNEEEIVTWHNIPDNVTVPSEEILQETVEKLRILRPIYLLRKMRNDLLKETDIYMSVVDFPILPDDRQELMAYRQQLRDLPNYLRTSGQIFQVNETNLQHYFPPKPSYFLEK